jgi:hypothetical protein
MFLLRAFEAALPGPPPFSSISLIWVRSGKTAFVLTPHPTRFSNFRLSPIASGPISQACPEKSSSSRPGLCSRGIAFVTLSPIGLRPNIADPNLERFAAFAVLGLLLGMAYPGRRALFAVTIVVAAVLLEALQLFIPDRDAEYLEMLIKAAGGLAGMGFAAVLSRVFPRKD